ncbi:hypothetical protein FRC16_002965 [Serendipita sp. 398]|nr:hypothetical protein FRC16_002965 [Serendipita sp. 398]
MELARNRRRSSGAPGSGPVWRSGRVKVVHGETGSDVAEPHPLVAASYKWLFGDAKQAVETDTKCSNLLLIRISFGYKSRSVNGICLRH